MFTLLKNFKIKKASNFKLAYLKLTVFYVLIIMAVSITFSLSLYKISSDELGQGLGRQSRVMKELPKNNIIDDFLPDFEEMRQQQLKESNQHLQTNLIYFNLLILLLSSLLSYFWAKKTIQPIEEMVLAQNRFTADASHELRTPLTAMRSEIEVFLRDKNQNLSEGRKLLSSNLEEIEKLEALSSALLKLAKYQEDVKSSFKQTSLIKIITRSFEKVESLAEKKSIEFKNQLNEVEIIGDQISLIELFVILLENAIKYSPEKSTISISIKSDGHNATVKIKDQGSGIKASDLPHIFNRFYRADHSRTKNENSGYGLGLAIAKNIVDLHQGIISAKSEQGSGSEFTVKLPIS
jgi:signal transduction histidine kinase